MALRDWGYNPVFDDDPDDTPGMFRYQRIPVTIDLIGTWTRQKDVYGPDVDEHEGELVSIELNADDTFVYRAMIPDRYDWELRGTWTHDPDNMYINLVGTSVTNHGEPVSHWTAEMGSRFAYAPTGDGGIMISGWWNEPPAETSVENDNKYGCYCHWFYK